MRLALISDIHANLEALRATLQAISAQPIDRLVCLGDVVGYNTDAAECIALLRHLNPLWIAGNHDRAVTGQIPTQGFTAVAARAIPWTRERLPPEILDFLAALPLKTSVGGDLVAVHGALHPERGCELVRLDNDERRKASFAALAAHFSGARVCAHGHTHRASVYELRDGVMRACEEQSVALRDDAYYLINPGTVGEPRAEEQRATYMIFDTDRRAVHRAAVAYDRWRTRAKSRRAGLLPRSSMLPAGVRRTVRRVTQAAGIYDRLKGWGF